MNTRQVLIINITRMGDLIQMVPLLSRLGEEWPGVAIDLVIDKEFAHVAPLIPGIRQVWVFDFQLLMDESRVRARDVVSLYQDLARWARPLLQVGYDRVVNLTFNRRSAFLVKFLGCPDERGLTTAQDGSFLVKNAWMKYFVDFQKFRQLNRFNIVDLFALGGSGPGTFFPLRLQVSSHWRDWARTYLSRSGKPDVWIGVQIGASDPMKAWRPQYFGQMMAQLSRCRQVGFLLIGSKKEEPVVKEALSSFRQAHGQGILCEAVGQTSIPQLASLLEQCRLMVTNDTGPMHMAVGVGTQVLNISVGHVDFWETGPYGPGHWVVQPDIACGPCGFDQICSHHSCKDRIIPQEISQLCTFLLDDQPFPSFSSHVRVYESGMTEDQLGTFWKRAGSEERHLVWYGEYWRQYWYETLTGYQSCAPLPQPPPPDFPECERVWHGLASQLDLLCDQADTISALCRQQPLPTAALKARQQQLRNDTLLMQQDIGASLAFGPLASAFFRDTFSLEAGTMSGMAEEYALAYHLFRARASEHYARLDNKNSVTPRRAFHASATG